MAKKKVTHNQGGFLTKIHGKGHGALGKKGHNAGKIARKKAC